ncbi:MAG: hypothetical protein FRX49_02037 [Trebouxia sp. A1-2]|nr:MAG: hypothetical protein FRX49_02037 [Trebouxia sp. A1-2]
MDCQLVASSSSTSEARDAVNASGRQLFAQFKQLLEAAEAKVTGYDELHALLQNEQRSVGQLERALQLQQRHIDRFTAQDLLLAQLTQQMGIQAQALEQLQNTCRHQKQQLASAKAEASQLQQEVGHRRKRIEALEWHGACQEQSISKLEHRVHEYKRICAYVARESQDIDFAVEQSNIKSPDQLSSDLAETEAGTNVAKDLQDSSLAEGAAGLLAMTTSTADRLRDAQCARHDAGLQQSSDGQLEHALRLPMVNTESSNKEYCGSLANIKVQGSNGRNQMLKVWLPGLMQLVGDHAKAAVARDAHISTLLDPQSGLRILPSED